MSNQKEPTGIQFEEEQVITIRLDEGIVLEWTPKDKVWLAYPEDESDEVIVLESEDYHFSQGEVIPLFDRYDLDYDTFQNIQQLAHSHTTDFFKESTLIQ